MSLALLIFFMKTCSVKEKFEEIMPMEHIRTLPQKAMVAKASSRVANKKILKDAIELFQTQEGRYPKELKELVYKGYMHRIPEGSWRYDGSGKLE